MKKLFILVFTTFTFAANVTFNVNMAEQDVGNEGPTLWMGHLYPDAGFIMTDDNEDNIWSYTIDLEPGTYTYKFRNGWWSDWNTGDGWEEVPQECEVGQWGDREMVVEGDTDIVLDIVCFGGCTEECIETIYSNVTFQVDMSDQNLSNDDIVYIQGTLNGWCGYCNPMSDVNGDDIWELTLELPIGEYEYIFTTNGWDGLQGGAPIGSDCDWIQSDSYGNYGFILEEQDLLLGPYCFETCWATCQPPAEVDVTFSVDMSNENISNNVYMIGNFQTIPWTTEILPTIMLDDDGDGIYTTTIGVLSDDIIEYKFVNGTVIETDNNIGSCGNNPNSTCDFPGPDCNNREFQVPSCEIDESGDCTLEPIITEIDTFNSCGLVLADVNFSIDLNYTGLPNSDYDQCGVNGSWCATESGDWPGWCLTLNDDNNDNIFTGTLENISSGDYEFIVFCSGAADNFSGWGTQLGPTVGSECDWDNSDEFGNYGFSITDSDIDISYCAGSCEETCSLDCNPDLICAEILTCFGTELYPTACGPDNCDEPIIDTDGICSDNNIEYSITFDIDGVDECGFVSVTGTFDNWSGWGAHTDNGMTAFMTNGEYEYTILCVDTSANEWWNDIWGNSTQFSAPIECDWDPSDEYANYGLTVSDNNMTISLCAGGCEETCENAGCTANGDTNGDGILNVVDVVSMVGYILGTIEYSDGQICASDLNGDTIINVVDIVAIVGLILG